MPRPNVESSMPRCDRPDQVVADPHSRSTRVVCPCRHVPEAETRFRFLLPRGRPTRGAAQARQPGPHPRREAHTAPPPSLEPPPEALALPLTSKAHGPKPQPRVQAFGCAAAPGNRQLQTTSPGPPRLPPESRQNKTRQPCGPDTPSAPGQSPAPESDRKQNQTNNTATHTQAKQTTAPAPNLTCRKRSTQVNHQPQRSSHQNKKRPASLPAPVPIQFLEPRTSNLEPRTSNSNLNSNLEPRTSNFS